jgi:hypothetical protein
MPKRIINEKTGTAGTATERATRTRNNKGASSDYAYEDKDEMKGIDEDLANPELERLDDEDEEDEVTPPPLDGSPSRR